MFTTVTIMQLCKVVTVPAAQPQCGVPLLSLTRSPTFPSSLRQYVWRPAALPHQVPHLPLLFGPVCEPTESTRMHISDPFPLNTDPPKSRAMRGSTAAAAFLHHSWSDLVNTAPSMLQGALMVPAAHPPPRRAELTGAPQAVVLVKLAPYLYCLSTRPPGKPKLLFSAIGVELDRAAERLREQGEADFGVRGGGGEGLEVEGRQAYS
ncbi:hypothetical protein B0H14DRAFT_2560981 [Mycena olivaceomarginata]|nr:hypothetical protein B0H14DRAFT_2560981 [Mycena olivaceomarginata]